MINPCLDCGACCAFFRISFYWGESDSGNTEGVPTELTEKLNDFRMVMKGSNGAFPRCVALMGIVGKKVSCFIYAKRSSVCRDFQPSWLGGVHNEGCDRARRHWGMLPLTPEIWTTPGDNFPRKAA
ncbi:MAG: zinc/iron-chelating domain-containing protein [Desulfobulbaceae bacterium DB1]|nr:MAG: zinc/iron-chelating domain-containing protein [Desulfobulbaceae bacterium DB1]